MLGERLTGSGHLARKERFRSVERLKRVRLRRMREKEPLFSVSMNTVLTDRNLHEVVPLMEWVTTHLWVDLHTFTPVRGDALDPAHGRVDPDAFDLEISHVIPAMIQKPADARERGGPLIVPWGHGAPTRELLFVEDRAEAFVLAAERFDGSDPVDPGAGRETSTSEFAEVIAAFTGHEDEIPWDSSRPDAQPRRCLEVSRTGFTARTELRVGLDRTIGCSRAEQACSGRAAASRRSADPP